MARANYIFTSESVSEGHPDKICDQISDAILDAFLTEEEMARVACETFATTNRVVIGGEVGLADQSKLKLVKSNVEAIVRKCVRDIGYEQKGFHWETLSIDNLLHEQSAHIAQGVDNKGAGDQGIMFGYATDETPELMPAPIQYSHAILRNLAEARHSGALSQLGPDAKSQISVRYKNGKPVGVTSIVLSTQHLDETLSSSDVRDLVEPYIRKTLPKDWISAETEWHVNPTGKFVIGGPDGDAGLTGRKIIVDTYGGAARCTIQLSYAIGVAKPLSIYCDTHGTGQMPDEIIEKAVSQAMDLTPVGIIDHLKLRRPVYARTAAYGHFGRTATDDGGFSWEKTDLVDTLKSSV